jgi:hypothetical protein
LADLSIDDLRRLARNFLVGRGGEAELEDTKRAMDQDPQLAMEFLQQMQTALDDVAPAGFSPAQWSEIDARVHSLIAPLAKSGLSLGFLGKLFAKLFKKKAAPAEAPARIKRKGANSEPAARASGESPTSLLSSEAVVAPSTALPTEGMEEMAPIMSGAAAAAPVPVAPLADAPPVGAALARPSSVPAAPQKNFLGLAMALLALALLAWAAWTGLRFWKTRQRSAAPAPITAPPALPAPKPTPSPVPTGGPSRRALPPSPAGEPLPSELPPMTPQPAGKVEALPGLEANDSEGRRALPLP